MLTRFASPRSTTVLRSVKSSMVAQARFLNLHEFQSKELMNKFGVNTQRWALATTAEEAKSAAINLKAKELVLKAQIHAGGRGKGTFSSGLKGGVQLSTDPAEIEKYAKQMLGYKLVTKQTPPEGVLVSKLMVAESLNFDRELYLAILMDRASNGPVLVASPKGGMDIEQVAEEDPNAIFKRPIDISKGITKEDTKYIAEKLGFGSKNIAKAQEQIERLYNLFIKSDATQVEINPFVETKEGDVYCVDAKINFDDNASFRQKDIFNYRDIAEEDPREVAASKFNLNYIGMDGTIGCMVNGAGLAMATMDIIKLYGGEPANFLDVGGGANEQQVKEAFKIITADPKVKGLLVNIFGGIMKCDTIAQGIINAAKEIKLSIPLVVRLEGTNVDIGKKLLKESGLPIITADNLDDAAQKAVKSISGK
eukprot:TRINITY_DN1513_c0_g2_i1.p1 TRINITY_DN1513_c0_g2~~TRINITY_DN1513_c0_g2_i1.p1  ORF type:complete len:423 (+),score=150.99 TRINITY_DN1513_c0_g2_i1:122-1390(+)